jgi:hypothetical protein
LEGFLNAEKISQNSNVAKETTYKGITFVSLNA